MTKKEPHGEMENLVDAVEASRPKTHIELIAEIRKQLAGKNGEATKFETIIAGIEGTAQSYQTIEQQRSQAEQSSPSSEEEQKARTDILGKSRTKLGYCDNFFRRESRELRELLEKIQIDSAENIALLIVNGYRESIGAPRLSSGNRNMLY